MNVGVQFAVALAVLLGVTNGALVQIGTGPFWYEATDTSAWASINCGPGNQIAVFESEDEFDSIGAIPTASYYIGARRLSGEPYFYTPDGNHLPYQPYMVDDIAIGTDQCLVWDGTTIVVNDCTVALQYVCQTRDECEGDACIPAEPFPDRDTDDMCFWNPLPECVVTKKEAVYACKANYGWLFTLKDIAEVAALQALPDPKPFSTDDSFYYWTGYNQEVGESSPLTESGYQANPDLWETSINIRTSTEAFDHTLLFNPADGLHDLKPDTEEHDVIEGFSWNNEAGVICNAPKDDFCEYNAPKVYYSEVSVIGDDIVYVCKENYKFIDDEPSKSIPCGCDPSQFDLDETFKCVLINPCEEDAEDICDHGHCHFTNQEHRPFYCDCPLGFELRRYTGSEERYYCVDINECADGTLNDCPDGLSGGCINKPGTYECFCRKGYGWDAARRCIKLEDFGARSITFIATVGCEYEVEYGDVTSDEYEAMFLSIQSLFAGQPFPMNLEVDSIYVRASGGDSMVITININTPSGLTIEEQSVTADRFAQQVAVLGGIDIGPNVCSIIGGVYFQNTLMNTQIHIDDSCSIMDALGRCTSGQCFVDPTQGPVCHCPPGHQGRYCDYGGEDLALSPAIIGLIVAVCILFILIIVLIICLICICCMVGRHGRRRRRVVVGQAPTYGSPAPFSQAKAYASNYYIQQ